MSALLRHWAVFALALVLLVPGARADTPVNLFRSFAGNVNFTGTQVTIRTNPYCDTYQPSRTIPKVLSGIPEGAQILYARLYWAGSGATPDYNVRFQNKNFSAAQQYTSRYSNGGRNFDYFAGAADVTSTVVAKRNGNYTFSGLTIDRGNPYCQAQGVLGGFSLLVVYSHSSEPFRVLNIYEGLQSVRYGSISLSVGNFKVPDPLGPATGRIAHITWEGDLALDQQGEDLKFNGNVMTDTMNLSGNQFNSKSNINNDSASWGIDFDAYTVGAPVIQPGQTTATTVYSSGQDMVLLNAEIVALPNVPVADLQISMTRSGDPFAGQGVTYTLMVRNNGPHAETGPITVTDTLPDGMTFFSASGTGWTCSQANGKVTCTRPGPLASGQNAPNITVTAAPPSPGTFTTFTNTASVAGKMFDNVAANNTAVDTADDPRLGDLPWAITVGQCAEGARIGSSEDCRVFTGSLVAGEEKTLYITRFENGLATPLHKNQQRTRLMRFSLTCHNPARDAGVAASINGRPLPLCLQNGAAATANSDWSDSFTLEFPGGQPSSSPQKLQYRDVGDIRLNLIDNLSNDIVWTRFVSRPSRLRLTVTRQNDEANPGPMSNQPGFVKAGEPFKVHIQALRQAQPNEIPSSPPNFGKETPPVTVTLGQDVEPAVAGSLAMVSPGTFTGLFSYHEAGYIELSARLRTSLDANANHYLGIAVPADSVTVGRFYPAYFITQATTGFDCLPPMACPTGFAPEQLAPDGAAYSGEPFVVTVTAHGMVKTDPLTRHAVDSDTANQIRLSALHKPGPSGSGEPLGNTLQGQTTISEAAPGTPLSATLHFILPDPPPPTETPKPATIYLRAEATETRHGHPSETISSMRAAPAVSAEGGVQVVSGRLMVGSQAGSELLKMPIKLTAEYWTGTTWSPNIGDSYSVIPLDPEFIDCQGTICSPGVALLPGSPLSLTLEAGSASFWLAPPGAGKKGRVDIRMEGTPSWLPSTTGRATFGTTRNKVIYIREVY